MNKLVNFNTWKKRKTFETKMFKLRQWEYIDIIRFDCENVPFYALVMRYDDIQDTPHFHVVDKETMGKRFASSIKFDKPEYLTHKGFRHKLNVNQIECLIDAFKKDFGGVNGYMMLVYSWNSYRSAEDISTVSKDIVMPDYRLLRN